ncbi:MAG: membrane protein insertion efficiency factor YidD [Candidatus Omnitrophota bacterium]
MKNLLICAIKFYRCCLRTHLAPACKYHPTCSEYAIEAIKTKGALRGCAIAAWRLLRCNPFSKGGYDPVG